MNRTRWPHVSAELTEAIHRLVRNAGGTLHDAQDLSDQWERLNSDRRGRLDRLRFDAAHPPTTSSSNEQSDASDPWKHTPLPPREKQHRRPRRPSARHRGPEPRDPRDTLETSAAPFRSRRGAFGVEQTESVRVRAARGERAGRASARELPDSRTR